MRFKTYRYAAALVHRPEHHGAANSYTHQCSTVTAQVCMHGEAGLCSSSIWQCPTQAFHNFKAPSVDHVASRFLCGCCAKPMGPLSATCTTQQAIPKPALMQGRHTSQLACVHCIWPFLARWNRIAIASLGPCGGPVSRQGQDCTALHATFDLISFAASCKAAHDIRLSHKCNQHYMVGSTERTCSTLSSLPMVSKQKTLPSSPRQYR